MYVTFYGAGDLSLEQRTMQKILRIMVKLVHFPKSYEVFHNLMVSPDKSIDKFENILETFGFYFKPI